mmetsp:Transcript_87093/g.154100  ORF Transcript_87093/g.154100 Transcript_87093/m.154100 type:complete len:86 (-) Transcript_87093:757-1014(-)
MPQTLRQMSSLRLFHRFKNGPHISHSCHSQRLLHVGRHRAGSKRKDLTYGLGDDIIELIQIPYENLIGCVPQGRLGALAYPSREC